MTLKEKLRLGCVIVALLLLLLFVLFNLEKVTVNVIVMEVRMPAAFLILFSALLGAIATWMWYVVKPKLRKHEGQEH